MNEENIALCIDSLLNNYWICKKKPNNYKDNVLLKEEEKMNEIYDLIAANKKEINSILSENLGGEYTLWSHNDPYIFKLNKIPTSNQNNDGIDEFENKLDYQIYYICLAFIHSRNNKAFMFNKLKDYIDKILNKLKLDVDWTKKSHRCSLIRAINKLKNLKLIWEIDSNGKLEDFEKDEHSSMRILYHIEEQASHYLPITYNNNNITNYDTFNEYTNDVKPSKFVNEKQKLIRELLFEPVINRSAQNDVLYQYLQNNTRKTRTSIEKFIQNYTDYQLEITKNATLVTLDRQKQDAIVFPSEKKEDKILLKLLSEIRKHPLSENEYGEKICSKELWINVLGKMKETDSKLYWTSSFKNIKEIKTISDKLIKLAIKYKLIDESENTIKLLPIINRYDYKMEEITNDKQ